MTDSICLWESWSLSCAMLLSCYALRSLSLAFTNTSDDKTKLLRQSNYWKVLFLAWPAPVTLVRVGPSPDTDECGLSLSLLPRKYKWNVKCIEGNAITRLALSAFLHMKPGIFNFFLKAVGFHSSFSSVYSQASVLRLGNAMFSRRSIGKDDIELIFDVTSGLYRTLPGHCGSWSCLSTQHCWRSIWSTVSNSRLLITRETWIWTLYSLRTLLSQVSPIALLSMLSWHVHPLLVPYKWGTHLAALPFAANIHVLPCSLRVSIPAQESIG